MHRIMEHLPKNSQHNLFTWPHPEVPNVLFNYVLNCSSLAGGGLSGPHAAEEEEDGAGGKEHLPALHPDRPPLLQVLQDQGGGHRPGEPRFTLAGGSGGEGNPDVCRQPAGLCEALSHHHTTS